MKKRLSKILTLALAAVLVLCYATPVMAASNTTISMDGSKTSEYSTEIAVTANITGTSVISYTITAPAGISLTKGSNNVYSSTEYNVIVRGTFDNVTISCESTTSGDTGNKVTLTKTGSTTKSRNGTFYLSKTSNGSGTSVTLNTDAERLTAIETGYTLYGKIQGVEGLMYGSWTGGVKFKATQS